MKTFGFIGMGNMGFAMLRGLLNSFPADDIIFSCATESKRNKVKEETGVVFAKTNAECVQNAKYIILAVKPQMYDKVITDISEATGDDTVIISLSPSHSIEALTERLGGSVRIIRAMPNTPATIGCGMTGVCFDSDIFSDDEKVIIDRFFNSFGKYRKVEEKYMNTVTCASGSSPAYVYMFIETMADACVKHGMPWSLAYDFVTEAFIGAARMVSETKEHPSALRDNVCSPGGTTIAGVSALEENGFRNAVIKAVDACFEKCNNIK